VKLEWHDTYNGAKRAGYWRVGVFTREIAVDLHTPEYARLDKWVPAGSGGTIRWPSFRPSVWSSTGYKPRGTQGALRQLLRELASWMETSEKEPGWNYVVKTDSVWWSDPQPLPSIFRVTETRHVSCFLHEDCLESAELARACAASEPWT